MRRRRRNNGILWLPPERVCKYHINEMIGCYNYTGDPDKCKDCSRNPNRFDNKPMTPGQKICLTQLGFTEEEIKDWDFKKASDEIGRLRK